MINKTLLYNNIKNDIKNEELRTLYLFMAKNIDENVNINTIYDDINKVLAIPPLSYMSEDEADYIGCAFYDYILDLLY